MRNDRTEQAANIMADADKAGVKIALDRNGEILFTGDASLREQFKRRIENREREIATLILRGAVICRTKQGLLDTVDVSAMWMDAKAITEGDEGKRNTPPGSAS